jgi:hypothetical protein
VLSWASHLGLEMYSLVLLITITDQHCFANFVYPFDSNALSSDLLRQWFAELIPFSFTFYESK